MVCTPSHWKKYQCSTLYLMTFYIDFLLISKQIMVFDQDIAGFNAAQLLCNCFYGCHSPVIDRKGKLCIVHRWTGYYWHNFTELDDVVVTDMMLATKDRTLSTTRPLTYLWCTMVLWCSPPSCYYYYLFCLHWHYIKVKPSGAPSRGSPYWRMSSLPPWQYLLLK